jgi:hypothetical protein
MDGLFYHSPKSVSKETPGTLERFGLVFCAKVALCFVFVIYLQRFLNFSIWVRLAKLAFFVGG